MIEKTNSKIEQSYLYGLILSVIALFKKSYIFSASYKFKVAKNKENIKKSIFYKTIQKLSAKIDKISNITSRLYRESFLSAIIDYFNNNLKKNSVFASIISKISLSKILILYPLVDYLLRNVLNTARIATLWDEMLFALMLGYIFIRRFIFEKKWKISGLDFAIIFYLITLFLHFMWVSPDLEVAIDGLRANIQYILWFFVLHQLIDSNKMAKDLLKLFLNLAFLVSLHAIYQYIAKVPMLGNWVDSTEQITTRAYSIMLSPNLLGSFFTLSIPLAFGFFLASKKALSKLYYMIILMTSSLGLLFTLSRGAWIAAFIAIVVYLILTYKKVLLPTLIIISTLIVNVSSLSDRFFRLFSSDYAEKSARGGRIFRFNAGLEEWAKDKILGVGMGRFGGAVAMNYGLAPFYMDNYYMKTLVETGIFGLVAMIIFLLSSMILLYLKIRKIKLIENRLILIGVYSAMAGVLVHNLFENVFEAPQMLSLFWAFAAIIISWKENTIKKEES